MSLTRSLPHDRLPHDIPEARIYTSPYDLAAFPRRILSSAWAPDAFHKRLFTPRRSISTVRKLCEPAEQHVSSLGADTARLAMTEANSLPVDSCAGRTEEMHTRWLPERQTVLPPSPPPSVSASDVEHVPLHKQPKDMASTTMAPTETAVASSQAAIVVERQRVSQEEKKRKARERKRRQRARLILAGKEVGLRDTSGKIVSAMGARDKTNLLGEAQNRSRLRVKRSPRAASAEEHVVETKEKRSKFTTARLLAAAATVHASSSKDQIAAHAISDIAAVPNTNLSGSDLQYLSSHPDGVYRQHLVLSSDGVIIAGVGEPMPRPSMPSPSISSVDGRSEQDQEPFVHSDAVSFLALEEVVWFQPLYWGEIETARMAVGSDPELIVLYLQERWSDAFAMLTAATVRAWLAEAPGSWREDVLAQVERARAYALPVDPYLEPTFAQMDEETMQYMMASAMRAGAQSNQAAVLANPHMLALPHPSSSLSVYE